MKLVAIVGRVTGVDQTTPWEDGASATGGVVAGSGSFQTPTATKTTTAGLAICAVGGRGAATSNWTLPLSAGWTGSAYGTTPWSIVAGIAHESTPAAPGSVVGPLITLAASKSLTSWGSRIGVLRPAVGGVAPVRATTGFTNTADVTPGNNFAVTMPGSQANNDMLSAVIVADDPNATLSSAGWTERSRVPYAGGVLYTFYRFITASLGSSVNFAVATTDVPSLTTAAVISASHSPAHTGDVLNVDTQSVWAINGSAIDNYQRKLQRDTGSGWADVPGGMGGSDTSTNASQASLGTHTITTLDDDAALRYAERAHNSTDWSAWEPTNSVAVLDAPANVTVPVIAHTAGPTSAGGTLSVVTPGDYGDTVVEALSYQWFSGPAGATLLTGETGTSYTTVPSDEGKQVRVRERASNNGGAQTTDTYSNIIVPDVTAPLSAENGLVYLSGGTGNTDPALSIGGARGGTYTGLLSAIFGPIPGSVAALGGTLFALLYLRNTHTITTAEDGSLYVSQQFANPGLELAVAVPTQGVNTVVPALASGTTPPTGVTFTTTEDPEAGLAYGDLAPSDYRGFWLRLDVAPGTDADAPFEDTARFAVAFV